MHHMISFLKDAEWDFQETPDGVQINIKGDAKKIMAQLEAAKAFLDFKSKAKAAGWHHGHGFHPGHGFHGKMKDFFGKHHGGGHHGHHHGCCTEDKE